ncbi:MAG TPA: hypothetical protein PK024_10720 [Methanospirillum sp.]|uniref:hypothetical protein n=1 Tax=Methanospirillum sp. TaxID=45200 RepID=UPI002C6D8CF5|nr:hypothetical protein [Methanospirillum sp.]HOJ97294.1 hypothetical protein [Methanospirillum sp.]HPP77787.1 hypothetical protein [Methanospirillum sp.]
MQCIECKFQKDEKLCRKRRKNLDEVSASDCRYFEPSLYYQFRKFIEEEWDERNVYMTTDFVDKFNITRHLSRHYLYDIFTRKERMLFRVKFYNKAYYFKRTPQNVKEINEYRYIGIKIEMN